MSLLPLFRPILERGVKAPKAATDPILWSGRMVTELCSSGAGILADSSWTTIHVFFDTVHVADIVLDVEGVDFCYEEGGPMEIDPRCNIVLYAAMRVLSEMGDSDMGPLPD
jgi:hypothetical protein